jgi:hypothetical protein
MRFDAQAYEKVFPETAQTVPIESAVDTFKPTEAEMAMDNKPGADVQDVAEMPVEANTNTENIPEGEQNG